MGTTTAQKKLFFNLKKIKNQLSIHETGDLSPKHVNTISKQLNVKEEEVISMNRRLHGKEKSLNAPISNEEKQKLLESTTLEDKIKNLENIIDFYLHEINLNNLTIQ